MTRDFTNILCDKKRYCKKEVWAICIDNMHLKSQREKSKSRSQIVNYSSFLFLVSIEQGEGYKGVGMSKIEENESKSKETK